MRPNRVSIRWSLAAIAAMAAAVLIIFVFGQDLIPKASPSRRLRITLESIHP